MAKKLRILGILLTVIFGLGLLWWLFGPKQPSVVRLPPGAPAHIPSTEAGAETPVSVRTFKAARTTFSDTLPTTGTVRGQVEVPLKFEVNGVVKEIYFREGELIEKGEVVAKLNDKEAKLRIAYARSKLDGARAQAKQAAKRLEIHERLFRLGAIIRVKLEEVRAEFEQAEAGEETARRELDLAKAELDKTVLKAPVSAVVGTRDAEPGEFVTQQKTICLLADVASVFVELGIIERDIEKIQLGQSVKITVDAFPGVELTGSIEQMTPIIEGKSRTLTAKVKVVNETGALLPGMFARAEITVFEEEDALIVPTTALQDLDGDGAFEAIYVVEDDLTSRVRNIQLGYLATDYAQILDGLIDEEQVVVEAYGSLKDGSPVHLIETEEAGVQRQEPEIGSVGGQR